MRYNGYNAQVHRDGPSPSSSEYEKLRTANDQLGVVLQAVASHDQFEEPRVMSNAFAAANAITKSFGVCSTSTRSALIEAHHAVESALVGARLVLDMAAERSPRPAATRAASSDMQDIVDAIARNPSTAHSSMDYGTVIVHREVKRASLLTAASRNVLDQDDAVRSLIGKLEILDKQKFLALAGIAEISGS